MRVAVVHGPRVCLCRFGLDPNPRHRVEDTGPPPVEPSGHSHWTDPERCWLGLREQHQNVGRLQAAEEKLQCFLVTDANDIKKHVAPSRISHGHTGEHETRFDVTQGMRFE